MKKNKTVFITGFSGFVARHFMEYLYLNHIEWKVVGIDINQVGYSLEKYKDRLDISFEQMNLLDVDAVKKVCKKHEPDYILHLASFSSVAYSWKNPNECFVNNTNIFLNLITAIRELNLKCRILSIGSSEEYGNVDASDLPLDEEHSLNPISPYAVARVSQEMLSKVFVDSYQMDIILTRSFNHIGPWQDERFVVPSFIRKILQVKESGAKSGVIETGDVQIIRDFVDVRDVARAYYELLTKGKVGEVYNICSGIGRSLSEVIQIISEKVEVKITCQANPEFIRPNDNKIIVGDNSKLQKEIGWVPQIDIVDTIGDMVDCLVRT